MTRRSGDGFTVAELLVVLTLVAVLSAVLLPALARAREMACGSACASHLHQISLAFTAYFQDYDNTFPACGTGSIQSLEDLDHLWFRQLSPYLKDPHVLHCPADNVRNAQRTLSAALPEFQDRPGLPATSYGANWELMKAGAAGALDARVDTWSDPARMLLVADCTEPWAFGPIYTDAQGLRWSHVAYANGPPVHAPTTLFNGGRSGAGQERHGTGSFIAYCDGHVGFLPASRFYRGARFVVTDRSGEGHAILVQRPLISPSAESPAAGQQP